MNPKMKVSALTAAAVATSFNVPVTAKVNEIRESLDLDLQRAINLSKKIKQGAPVNGAAVAASMDAMATELLNSRALIRRLSLTIQKMERLIDGNKDLVGSDKPGV